VKNLTRAQCKKAMKAFKVGDVVTWGMGSMGHRVVEVTREGVVVDVTSQKDDPGAWFWSREQPDGKLFLTVLFDHNIQNSGPRCRFLRPGVTAGPPILTDMEPDKRQP
jgi:hypothetical protein